jgi:DNA-binding FadR family transcriptional regulator
MNTNSASQVTSKPDLTESIAEDIFSVRYAPGDLIPREIDLCEQYGVSRSTIRSALQTFVTLGILKKISGKGTQVLKMADWQVLDPKVINWFVLYGKNHKRFIKEMFEFRVAVEPFVSSLAALNANAANLLAIEDAFEGMINSLDREGLVWQGKSHSEYDVEFHEAIFDATNNLIWSQLSHVLHPSITLVVEESYIQLAEDTSFSPSELNDSIKRHRRLMEAIRLRQPDVAYAATIALLERTAQDLGVNNDTKNRNLPSIIMTKLAD